MPAVTRSSIDRFFVRHTTLGRLSKALNLSFQHLRFSLPGNGIEAIPVPKGTGRIYIWSGLKTRILESEIELPDGVDWSLM